MAEAGQEMLGGELLRMGMQAPRIEIPFALFEAAQGIGQALRGLFGKEQTGLAVHHGLGGAAASVGDDRDSGRHGLHRDDAEVFLTGEEQGPAACHELTHGGIVLAAHETHAGTCLGPELRHHLAVTGQHQRTAEAAADLHGQVHALVRGQTAEAEVVFPARFGPGREGVRVHRRMDNGGLAAPVFADAPGHMAGIGHEVVHPLGAEEVPLPQGRQQQAHGQAGEPPRAPHVGGPVVPQIAHGRVAVADVQAVGPGDDPLGGPGLAGDDQIVIRQVQLLQGMGHEGQVFFVQPAAGGQAVDEGGADPVLPEPGQEFFPVHHMGEDVRLRIEAAQGLQHFFTAGHVDQPVMHQSDLHARPWGGRRWRR